MLPIVNPYRDGLDRPAGPEGTFKHKAKKTGGSGVPSRVAFLAMLVCIVCGTYYLHLKYFASTNHKPSVRGSANTYRSFSDSVKDFAVDMQHNLKKLDEKKNPPIAATIDLKKPTDPSVQRSGKINTFIPEPKDPAKASDKKATAKPEPPKNLVVQEKVPRVIKRAETLTPDLMNRLQSENQFANAVEDKVLSLAAQAKEIKSREAIISNAKLAEELTPQQQAQEQERLQQLEQERIAQQQAQQELEQQQLRQQQEQQQAQQQEQERALQLQRQQELEQQQEEQRRQDLQRQQQLEEQQAQERRQRQEQEDQQLLQQHQQEEQHRMQEQQGRPPMLDVPPEEQHNAAAEEPPLLGPIVLAEEERPADALVERPVVQEDANQPPSVGAQEAATAEEQQRSAKEKPVEERPAREAAAPPVNHEPEEPMPQAPALQEGDADTEAPPAEVALDFPDEADPEPEGGALQALVHDRDVVPTAEVQSDKAPAVPTKVDPYLVPPSLPNVSPEELLHDADQQAAAAAAPASEVHVDSPQDAAAHADADATGALPPVPPAAGDNAPPAVEMPAEDIKEATQVDTAKELADIPEFISPPAVVPHLDPPAALVAGKAEAVSPAQAADPAVAEPPVPPVIITTTANNRPTGYDLPDLKIPAKAPTAEAAPGEKVDYCAGQVDPFRSTPVDTFQPPAGADFELASQWHSAVRGMVSKISKVKYGGEELRALIRTEVEALQVMRFKMFCKYA